MKSPFIFIHTTCCLLMLMSISATAQNSIDLVTLSGRLGLPSRYESPMQNQDAQELGVLVNVKAPIVLDAKNIWYNNLTYTHSAVSDDLSFSTDIMDPIGLHGFILQTGWVHKMSKKNAFQLLYVPRFMTDFQGYSSRVIQHGAIAMYEHRFSPTFMMRFGAMYNQELAGPLLVPLFDFNWQMTNRWSLTGLFPIYLKLNYKVTERFTAGLSHFGLITSYALHDPAYEGDYMERTSIDLTLFGRLKLYKNWYAEARFGYALNRTYAQYATDDKIDFRLSIFTFGDNRPDPKNLLFDDGPIAQLRLVYNVPLPQ